MVNGGFWDYDPSSLLKRKPLKRDLDALAQSFSFVQVKIVRVPLIVRGCFVMRKAVLPEEGKKKVVCLKCRVS